MKILVADDRGHLLASTLTSKGFETTLTSTWEDTQKVLGTQIFDVVLLDLFGNSHDSWESFLETRIGRRDLDLIMTISSIFRAAVMACGFTVYLDLALIAFNGL